MSRQNATADSISEAEQSLARAYVAALDAERAGANVSSLLNMLNEGADLLYQSASAFRDGNHEEATRLADLSSDISGSVLDEAARLKIEAEQAAIDRTWFYSITSVIAVSAVSVASLLGYRYFKRWYYKRLLRMKPAVEQA